MHIKLIDGKPVKYNIARFRKDNPGTSFPEKLSNELLAGYGIYPLRAVGAPGVQVGYQKAVEVEPVLVDGAWTQVWKVVQCTPDEVAAWQKEHRTEAVARIRVTTASGKVFDGDEISQTRMARAVIALQAAGQSETL